MAEKNNLLSCPVETMLIGDKWKILIIRDLRDMEENGLLTRETFPEAPPGAEYTLTEPGCSMFPIPDAMAAWGTEYMESRLIYSKPTIMAVILRNCCNCSRLRLRY